MEGIVIRKKGRFEAGRAPHEQTQASEPKRASVAPRAPKAPKEKTGKLSGAGKAGIIALAVVLILAVGACAYGFSIKNKDTIFPNVYIAGINVGDMTASEAKTAVETAVADSYSKDTLTVTLPDQTISFDPSATHVALNADEAVASAMRYGRTGGPISALLTYRSAKSNEHTIDLQSSLNLDTDYIRKTIDDAAASAKTELIQPQVTVDESAGTITVVAGSPAVSLDADKLYDTVIQRFTDNDFSPLTFDYDTTPCDPVDLQTYYDKYGTEMKDAYYDEKTHELVAEVKGYGFDVERYTQELAMAKAGDTVTIQMEDMEPEVTLEELKKEYFVDTLASFDSPHTYNSSRTNNLVLACKAINGTILNPGEEFSFNNVVGERTAAKGYQAAIVYQTGGVSTPELGGGVCQVASTIYYCTLQADLEVTHREPHMFYVSYVPGGLDATVYWGSTDYKFKNSTSHPIRIDASVSNGYVHITFIGTKEKHDWDHITLDSVRTATNYSKVKNQNGTYLTVNGSTATDSSGNKYNVGAVTQTSYTGYTYVAYKHYMDANGKELSKQTIGKTTYLTRDEIVQTTPYVEPTPVEPTTPTTPTTPDTGTDTNPDGTYTGDPSVTPGDTGTGTGTGDTGTGTDVWP